MKISMLIHQLVSFWEQEGDLPVYYYDEYRDVSTDVLQLKGEEKEWPVRPRRISLRSNHEEEQG